jgi:hypothetical protein
MRVRCGKRGSDGVVDSHSDLFLIHELLVKNIIETLKV